MKEQKSNPRKNHKIHNNLLHERITKSTQLTSNKNHKYTQLNSCRNYSNLHNSCHTRITKISTTNFMQELQKSPQFLSCKNYKKYTQLISRKIYKYINIHNSCHARITKVSTTLIIRELKKYPQCISCMIYKNINIHNSCHARITCKNIHKSYHARNTKISTTHIMHDLHKY